MNSVVVEYDPQEIRIQELDGLNQRIPQKDPDEQRENPSIHFTLLLNLSKYF